MKHPLPSPAFTLLHRPPQATDVLHTHVYPWTTFVFPKNCKTKKTRGSPSRYMQPFPATNGYYCVFPLKRLEFSANRNIQNEKSTLPSSCCNLFPKPTAIILSPRLLVAFAFPKKRQDKNERPSPVLLQPSCPHLPYPSSY